MNSDNRFKGLYGIEPKLLGASFLKQNMSTIVPLGLLGGNLSRFRSAEESAVLLMALLQSMDPYGPVRDANSYRKS